MKKGKLFAFNTTLGALLFICVFFNQFKIASVIAIITFISSLLVELNIYPIFFLKYFYISVSIATTIVSNIIIEFGNFFLMEVRSNAQYSGSLPLLLLSYYMLICVINYYEKKYHHKISVSFLAIHNNAELKAIRFANLLTLAIVTICYVAVFMHPAFRLHLERADYALGMNRIVSRLAVDIPRLLLFPCILVVFRKGKDRKIGLLTLIISILYYIWIGNKFGAFYQIICIFLVALSDYIITRVEKKRLYNIFIKTFAIFVILIVFALKIQSLTLNNGTILNYFHSRIAAESQLWWKIYDQENGKINISEIFDEFQSFELGNEDVRKSVGAHYGIYKMMYKCAPAFVVDGILSAGYRYTESGYASAFYYFGYIGPILYAITMGMFFAVITNKLSLAINNHQILRMFIYIRFWLYGTVAFSMFIFSAFFTPMSLLMLLYLIVTHGRQLSINFIDNKIKL